LRRPGRFDRELGFSLPDASARRHILDIHTHTWNPPLSVPFKNDVAQRTVGYCGADLKALCTEAAMRALRRRYPQIYTSTQKLIIKEKEVMVLRKDFADAMHAFAPAAHRSALSYAAALPPFLLPLLEPALEKATAAIVAQGMWRSPGGGKEEGGEETDCMMEEDEEEVRAVYGIINRNKCDGCQGRKGALVCCDFCSAAWHLPCVPSTVPPPVLDSDDPWRCPGCWEKEGGREKGIGEDGGGGEHGPDAAAATAATLSQQSVWTRAALIHRPRLLLSGGRGLGQAILGAALLHKLEHLPVFALDLPSLLSDASFSSPEQCLVTRVGEARRSAPCVLYLPKLEQWWREGGREGGYYGGMREALLTALEGLPAACPVLVLATFEEESGKEEGMEEEEEEEEEGGKEREGGREGLPSEVVRLFSPHGLNTALPVLPPLDLSAMMASTPTTSSSSPPFSSDVADAATYPYSSSTAITTISKSSNSNTSSYSSSYSSSNTPAGWIHTLLPPPSSLRSSFFSDLFLELTHFHHTIENEEEASRLALQRLNRRRAEVLPVATPRQVEVEEGGEGRGGGRKKEDPRQVARKAAKAEHLKREFRICLRKVLAELKKDKRYVQSRPSLPPSPPPSAPPSLFIFLQSMRPMGESRYSSLPFPPSLPRGRYSYFWSPVDGEEVPDYYSLILNPMDLETMRQKIDAHEYETRDEFRRDIVLIKENAKRYNPCGKGDGRGKVIVSAACNMVDHVDSMFHYFKLSLGYDIFRKLDKLKFGDKEGGEDGAGGVGMVVGGNGEGGGEEGKRSSRRLRGGEGGKEGGGDGEVFLELGPTEKSIKVQGEKTPEKARRRGEGREKESSRGEEGGGEIQDLEGEGEEGKEKGVKEQAAFFTVEEEGEGGEGEKEEEEKEEWGREGGGGKQRRERSLSSSSLALSLSEAEKDGGDGEDEMAEEGENLHAFPPSPSPPPPNPAVAMNSTATMEVEEEEGDKENELPSSPLSLPVPLSICSAKSIDGDFLKTKEKEMEKRASAAATIAAVAQVEEKQASGVEGFYQGKAEEGAETTAAAAASERQEVEEAPQVNAAAKAAADNEEETSKAPAAATVAVAACRPIFVPLAPERLERLKEGLLEATDGWNVERLLALRGALWRELKGFKEALKTMAAAGEGERGGEGGGVVMLRSEVLVDRLGMYVGLSPFPS